MVHSPRLNTGTLTIVDIGPARLRRLETLAKMVAPGRTRCLDPPVGFRRLRAGD